MTGHNLKVVVVDSVQIWTLVGSLTAVMGVFSTVMFAAFTMLRSSLLSEVRFELRSEVGTLHSEMDGLRSEMEGFRSEVEGFRSEINARFDGTDAKIDNLARVTDVRLVSLEGDMHLIKARLIGQQTA